MQGDINVKKSAYLGLGVCDGLGSILQKHICPERAFAYEVFKLAAYFNLIKFFVTIPITHAINDDIKNMLDFRV